MNCRATLLEIAVVTLAGIFGLIVTVCLMYVASHFIAKFW